MQSVLSRIWTCVAVSISYDDNHYTTGTSKYNCPILFVMFALIPDHWRSLSFWFSILFYLNLLQGQAREREREELYCIHFLSQPILEIKVQKLIIHVNGKYTISLSIKQDWNRIWLPYAKIKKLAHLEDVPLVFFFLSIWEKIPLS